MRKPLQHLVSVCVLVIAATFSLSAQRVTDLERVAVIERKILVPMRDGIHLATDVYRPKDAAKKAPAISRSELLPSSRRMATFGLPDAASTAGAVGRGVNGRW